jgi:orotate phosphoribosyltransferase
MSNDSKTHLLQILKKNSVFYGDFTLSSGGKSPYYIDCRLTTLNPEGACLVGDLLYDIIQAEAAKRNIRIDSIGGLTLGADPVALSVGMASFRRSPASFLQVFTVRKTPKGHGQTKLIEGNFKEGDHVVVVDDVVTRGDSTLKAVEAVRAAGGIVEFAVVLVDRQEGGRQNIEGQGTPLFALFTKSELIDPAKVKVGS